MILGHPLQRAMETINPSLPGVRSNILIDLDAAMPPPIEQQLRRENFVDLDQPLQDRSTPPPERNYFNLVHERTRILQRGDEQLTVSVNLGNGDAGGGGAGSNVLR